MTIPEKVKSTLLSGKDFDYESLALECFRFQADHNEVYKTYINHLKINPEQIERSTQIPYLPIELFKTHAVKTGNFDSKIVFTSSGTTSSNTSMHAVSDPEFYLNWSKYWFEKNYGNLGDWHLLCLLPSYQERTGSSLIFMLEHFLKFSNPTFSGFYSFDFHKLYEVLRGLKGKKNIMLFGVTYALLDFSRQYAFQFPELKILETGGMKGRGKELTRAEVHEMLMQSWGVDSIHSEYGMTELLSQAYSKGNGVFQNSPALKIAIGDVYDPFLIQENEHRGFVLISDLANIDSCCFIRTADLGRKIGRESFEIVGRFDGSDVRGCNLLMV